MVSHLPVTCHCCAITVCEHKPKVPRAIVKCATARRIFPHLVVGILARLEQINFAKKAIILLRLGLRRRAAYSPSLFYLGGHPSSWFSETTFRRHIRCKT